MGGFLPRRDPGVGPRHLMTLITPPVNRSQLTTKSSRFKNGEEPTLEHVKTRLSGEKMNTLCLVVMSCGGARVRSRRRVRESSISIISTASRAIAMNLSHGDQTASSILEEHVVAAMFVSHDIGAPCTTLTKGWTCDSYSFRTIDFWGASTSAV